MRSAVLIVLVCGMLFQARSSCVAAAATPTKIDVRVIAKDGKFVGDDIGGAMITIRDSETGEILASGVTHGGSGPATMMSFNRARNEPYPNEGASVFSATLQLAGPRQIEISARGPLAASGSANTASITQWVFPGKHLTSGDGVLLELRGLIVQILAPPTHLMAKPSLPVSIALRANVAMMCGCPIGPGQPWLPEKFEVKAVITTPGGDQTEVVLKFDDNTEFKAPSQFVGTYQATRNGIYQVVLYAYQPDNGNTGVDRSTFILQ